MGRKALPPKIKIVKGQATPIYAKGLTASEYVIKNRNPVRYKEYNKEWRKENRKEYNEYHREYYQANKNRFKTAVKPKQSFSKKFDTTIKRR